METEIKLEFVRMCQEKHNVCKTETICKKKVKKGKTTISDVFLAIAMAISPILFVVYWIAFGY